MDIDQKKKILIVDDDGSLRNALKDKINHEGFTALMAGDGEEGLKVGIKEKPDLILLDVIMPKINGIKMLEKLREDKWGEHVPVLLLSNDDDPEHIRETLKDNATDYLIKSDWELEDIIKKIKETLRL
ncbi:MAG: response regulator [Candidatus Microgenomates bacterium]|jgi:DNA-binding response OmpR family regulator